MIRKQGAEFSHFLMLGNEKELLDPERAIENYNDEIMIGVKKMTNGRIVELDKPIAFIRAGHGKSCAITDEGEVYIWGEDFGN